MNIRLCFCLVFIVKWIDWTILLLRRRRSKGSISILDGKWPTNDVRRIEQWSLFTISPLPATYLCLPTGSSPSYDKLYVDPKKKIKSVDAILYCLESGTFHLRVKWEILLLFSRRFFVCRYIIYIYVQWLLTVAVAYDCFTH